MKSQTNSLGRMVLPSLENLVKTPFIQNSLYALWFLVGVCWRHNFSFAPVSGEQGWLLRNCHAGHGGGMRRARWPFCAQAAEKRRAQGEKWVAGGCRVNFPKEAPPLALPAAFYKVDPVGFRPAAYLVFIWNMLHCREPFVFCRSRETRRERASVGRTRSCV